MNKFLKCVLFGSITAGLVFAGLPGLSSQSPKEAKTPKKQTEIHQINALNNSSEALLISEQYPDVLIEVLRASNKLKLTPWVQERSDTQILTIATLQQAVYLRSNEKKQYRATEENNLAGYDGAINNIAYSPNGQQLAAVTGDNTIKIWDVSSGKLLKSLTGYSNGVFSIAYSPNGQQLAGASGDSTIKIWDVSSGKLLKSLIDYCDSHRSIAYSPNGQQLASADLNIIFWDVSSGQPIKAIWNKEGRQSCERMRRRKQMRQLSRVDILESSS